VVEKSPIDEKRFSLARCGLREAAALLLSVIVVTVEIPAVALAGAERQST
jgi:hypothetical protein